MTGSKTDLAIIEAGTSTSVVDDAGLNLLTLIKDDIDYVTFDKANPDAGIVTFTDGNTITFSEIDRVVPCFTPGTAIATPKGEVPVERLRSGDRVLTRDNGIQTVSWVGTKRIDFAELNAAPQLRPIKIRAGALGNNMPDRDMLVSPSHRMLIVSHPAELYFGQSEVLVAARHMLTMDGVEVTGQPYVTYIHIMCQNHEIVLSNGAWSESFQPADLTLKGFDAEQREELFMLFPQLETAEGVAAYGAARRTLSRREAKLLFKP
ncbi:intein [Yoonia maricola]|uniref:Intein n=1 Tax=Yoonia maricola TaxID=420999 RepID=A0A2M8WLR9_9RHOB|nr:Hint domain-containing protein [Yoonia maricola]PJI91826.1 intein [Yoonia maricola]